VQPHFKHGADDPAGPQRRGRGKDDVQPHFKHGADDPAGDQRQGRGKDDGPNHLEVLVWSGNELRHLAAA
jgi:hypothetical protein